MPRLNLTSRFCETVRVKRGQLAYHDENVRGLELRVGLSRKSWSVRYRGADGKQRRLTLGEFDPNDHSDAEHAAPSDRPGLLNLDEARTAARAALVDVKRGRDPARERRVRRAAEKAKPVKTVDDLVNTYLDACSAGLWTPRGKRQRPRTLADQRGAYERHLKAKLGDEPLSSVTRAMVRTALRDLQKKGLTAQLNKAHQCLRQAYSWGVAEEHADDNPAIGLPRFAASKPKTRVLNDDELKRFWAALEDPAGLKTPTGEPLYVNRAHAIALELCTLLLQRRGEVAGIMDSELDLDQRFWRIPAERSKGNRTQTVPLSDKAVALIREAQGLRADDECEDDNRPNNRPLFPARTRWRDPSKPMHQDTLTHVMRDVLMALGGIPAATPHDLRRTGSTALTSERIGVSPFVRSLVLGHASDAGGGAAVSRQHYDVNLYLREKRQALTAWERLLGSITKGAPVPDNVTTLRGATA